MSISNTNIFFVGTRHYNNKVNGLSVSSNLKSDHNADKMIKENLGP